MLFLNPEGLWLLLLLPLAIWPLFVNRQMLSTRARLLSFSLRALAICLAVMALAEPALEGESLISSRPGGQDGVACLVDVSASVKPQEVHRALEAVRRIRVESSRPLELILFDRRPHRVEPEAMDSLATLPPADWLKTLGRGQESSRSDLERALRAAAELPVDTLLLFSDGNETVGVADKTLPVLTARGIRLDAIALEPMEAGRLELTRLAIPHSVLEGKEFEGRVTIRSREPGPVVVEIRRGEELVKEERVVVRSGVTLVPFKDTLEKDGPATYVARVTAKMKGLDDRVEDNHAHGVTRAIRVPRCLLISRYPGPVRKMLDAARIRHDWVEPADVPTRMAKLVRYSSVIIDNVDSGDFTKGNRKRLANYVKDGGGGLLAIGGEKGFGPGGWANTAVEKVLPVDSTPKGYDRGLGLMILLDSSGSMAGFPIEYARRATREIIGLMRGRWLGVINFSHVPEIAVSFQVIGADSYVVRKDINGIQAGGGTLFYRPLAQALDVFRQVPLEQKHVLMLSDGEASDFFMVRALYDRFDAANIKVSTMALGRHSNRSNLEELADSTGGRFYQGEDFSKLPKMFQQEVKRISGPPVVQQRFRPIRTGSRHPLAAALPKGKLPFLDGYDATSAKRRAQVLLTSPKGDPILAVWRIGLGKAAAFTADMGHLWGKDWVRWPRAPRFMGALLGELGKLEASDYHITASTTGSEGKAVVDAIDTDGHYLNFLELVGRVSEPSGAGRTVDFLQTGPGRYEAAFPLEDEGIYRIEIRARKDGSEKVVGREAVALPALREFRPAGANRGLLERLAGATGGELLVEPALRLRQAGVPAMARNSRDVTPVWPGAAMLALLFLLLEILCRRVGIFSGAAEILSAPSGRDGNETFQKIAEKYVREARDMDARGNHARASQAYLKARSYFLKAKLSDQAQHMWDRYRLLEDRHVRRP